MDIDITPLTAVAALATFVLAPGLALLVDAWWGHVRWQSVGHGMVVATSAAACWLLVWSVARPELDGRLILPIAGLSALAAVLVTVPFRHRSPAFTAAVAAVWTAGVFSPVAIALFSTSDGVLGAGLGTLDLGGACAVLITSGCGLSAVLVLDRRSPVARLDPPRPLVVPVLAAVWLLWLVWLCGLELVVDGVTARILVNALIAPVVSAVGWLVVQRIRHARTTAIGTVGGLFCGLVAVTAGCGYLDPLGAVLTGGIAGVTCSLIGYGLVRRTGRATWLLAVVLAVGASIGVILLGAFATRSGIMFTGQPEVLFSQFASVALVAAYSTGVSLVIWLGARRVGDRTPRTTARRRP